MPAATTKADLIAVTNKEFLSLSALLDTLSCSDALCPVADGWSTKDIIAHLAHWIRMFLGWHAEAQAGRGAHFPASDHNWGQVHTHNGAVRQARSGMSWEAVRVELLAAHDDLTSLLSKLSQHHLYAAPILSARSEWTTGRLAEEVGASHYRSAATAIRAIQRPAA